MIWIFDNNYVEWRNTCKTAMGICSSSEGVNALPFLAIKSLRIHHNEKVAPESWFRKFLIPMTGMRSSFGQGTLISMDA